MREGSAMARIKLDPKKPLTEEAFYHQVHPVPAGKMLPVWTARLEGYERKYGMSSMEAAERFEKGELPDTHDTIAWMGVFDLYRRHFKGVPR